MSDDIFEAQPLRRFALIYDDHRSMLVDLETGVIEDEGRESDVLDRLASNLGLKSHFVDDIDDREDLDAKRKELCEEWRRRKE